MKCSLVLFLAVLACAFADDVEVEDGVYVLTESNFDGFVKENEFVLVEFYAPWCGHCKALAPEYSKAAEKLKEEKSDIKLAKVDATEQAALGTKYEVRGFPTLKFFQSGTASDYGGGRTGTEIVNWLKKKTGPPAADLKSVKDAKTFADKDEVVVIGFFKDQEGEGASAFKKAAAGIDDIPFGITSEDSVLKEYKIKKDGIVLLKKFDEGRADFEGDFEEAAITKFIKDNQLPLIIEFTQTSAQKIFSGDVKKHALLFLKKEGSEETIAKFRAAAEKYKGKVLFIYLDMDNIENSRISDYFGVKESDAPTLRLIKLGDEISKYKPESSSLETKDVSSFVQAFLDGKLTPDYKSEDIPEDWDAKPVKVLVGKNFKEVALDKSKDVFVEFYAPWCGHCKQLAPIWDELGDKYKGSSEVIIAKMDATANEVPEMTVQGFPTLKFFPKNSDEIVDYNGERTMEAMAKFVDNGGVEEAPQEEEEEVEEEEEEEQEPEKKKDEL